MGRFPPLETSSTLDPVRFRLLQALGHKEALTQSLGGGGIPLHKREKGIIAQKGNFSSKKDLPPRTDDFLRRHWLSLPNDIYITFIKPESAKMRRDGD